MMLPNLTDSEVMTIIIDWMLEDATNPTYVSFLTNLKEDISRTKSDIEEQDEPRYRSIVDLGVKDLFIFDMESYRKMANEILIIKENRNAKL